MKKKILIIAYIFPLTPGIGGRRWAKFAKYLHRRGYDVRVIAAKVPYVQESNWNTDIQELANEDRITYIESRYPKYMYGPKTIFEKIMYKVSLMYLKLKVKGQYYDPSVLWEKGLIPVVEQHISDGYKTIVATGAPFRYLTFLGKLKTKYSDIKLIADIRDPWTTNKTGYGYDSLTKERFEFEKKLEKYMVKTFDTIITVYDETTEYFSTLDKTTKCNFVTIRNGFDHEDMKLLDNYIKKKSDKLTFVYVGNFYSKAIKNLYELIDTLDKIKNLHSAIYKNLQFDFYGDVPQEFFNTIKNHNEVIKYHGRIPLNSVASTIYNSNVAMLFLTDDMTYSFSTKFYEYLFLKRPLIIFSKEGKAGHFVEDNKLGFMIPQGDMYRKLLYAIDQIENAYKVNESFDLSQYDVENLTDEILKVIGV